MVLACKSCAAWAPKRAEKMAPYGFGCCAHAPIWAYFPPHHTCAKHKPAKEAVVAARAAWLAKINKTGATA